MASLSAYYPLPVVAGTTAGTYAEGDHSHELDELDASGIAAGKVLTANGLDAASWEDATGQVEEAPEDGTPYARKDADWTPTVGLEEDGSIRAIVQVRQGTAAELGEIVLNDGEIAIELEGGVPKQLKVGDGVTAGGIAPNINDWIIVQGTSEDTFTKTNSSTFSAIPFFENLPELEEGGIYEYFATLVFYIDNEGGIKLTSSIFGDGASISITGGEWPDAVLATLSLNEDYTDTGVINVRGNVKISEPRRFRVFLAQQTATGDGNVQFVGPSSYIAYRRLA